MRRTTFDKLLGWIGASLGIGLLAIGGLLLWGSAYVHNTVHNLLAGLFGFTRIRHEQPGATVWGPAIEQIHEAGASA